MKTTLHFSAVRSALLGLLALGLVAAEPAPAADGNAELRDNFAYAVAHGDFNGDGYDDAAMGAPGEDVGPALQDAGAVDVIYGGAGGLDQATRQFWTLEVADVDGTAEMFGYFGFAVAAGDFNADGYDDLAVGAEGETVDTAMRAGAVHVFHGTPSGLTATLIPDQRWDQDSPGVEDTAEDGDYLGNALATGDFNDDGYADLAISARHETLSAKEDAGEVHVLYGSAAGLSATTIRDQRWHQDVRNVEDVVEAGDLFGTSLTTSDFNADGFDDLAIGVPGESVNGVLGAGAVNVLYGSASGLSATSIADQRWNQDRPDVEDVAETGDAFGSSLAAGDFNDDGYGDLAIGVPSEVLSAKDDAGEVNVLYGSVSGLSATAVRDQRWHQDVNNVEDVVEAGDEFGSALAVADFNDDGYADLAIGTPGESVNSQSWAGAVSVLNGAASGLSATVVPDQRWNQDVGGVEDAVEASDRVGWALTAGDFNADGYVDLLIGVPYESLLCGADPIPYAGAVNLLYGATSGLSATAFPDQFLSQPCP